MNSNEKKVIEKEIKEIAHEIDCLRDNDAHAEADARQVIMDALKSKIKDIPYTNHNEINAALGLSNLPSEADILLGLSDLPSDNL